MSRRLMEPIVTIGLLTSGDNIMHTTPQYEKREGEVEERLNERLVNACRTFAAPRFVRRVLLGAGLGGQAGPTLAAAAAFNSSSLSSGSCGPHATHWQMFGWREKTFEPFILDPLLRSCNQVSQTGETWILCPTGSTTLDSRSKLKACLPCKPSLWL